MFRLCSVKKSGKAGKLRTRFAGFFLWGIVFLGISGCLFMTKDVFAKSPSICGEDEYVLLSANSNYAEIYDSQGTCVGRCRAYLDQAATIKKDFLVEYTSGDTCRIFSMAELKNILEFPGTEYSVEVCGNVCMAVNRCTGSFSLYDCHGNMLYGSGESEWAENQYQGQILGLENGYLMCVCRFTDTQRSPVFEPVWVSKDGKSNKVITAPCLAEAFADWAIQGFGDYVLVFDSETGTETVYDLDGNILLDQVDYYLPQYTDDNWFYGYNFYMPTTLVLQNEDGMYIAYDTKLQEIAMFPAVEDGYPDLGYAGGFLKGVSYQQLGGRVCAGFVRYKDTAWYPYAQTENGCLVYLDGQQIEIPLESRLTLTYFNETYVMADCFGDGVYESYLFDRDTGEILLAYSWEDGRGVSFELGKDYCIITETEWEDEDYHCAVSVLNKNQEICYSSEKGSAGSWKNGYMFLTRGIYHGIADQEGNWIIRTVFGEGE